MRIDMLDLPIEPRSAANLWIGIEDEAEFAAASIINPRIARSIDQDLSVTALEGLSEEQKAMVRRRAAWLAGRFIQERLRAKTLTCDDCGFDPASRIAGTTIPPRALMDVHHIHPLAEGVQYTGLQDFKLLCPNCHRLAHVVLRAQ